MKWPIAGGNGLPGTAGTRLVFPDSFEAGLQRVIADRTAQFHREILLSKHTARRDDTGTIIGTGTVTLFGLTKIVSGNPFGSKESAVLTGHQQWLDEAKATFNCTGLTITTDVHNHDDTGLRFGGPFFVDPTTVSATSPQATVTAPAAATPKA
jgi:hypothetical protein